MILCCVVMTACTNTGGVDAWVKSIYISKEDRLSEGTAKQILVHNETIETLDN